MRHDAIDVKTKGANCEDEIIRPHGWILIFRREVALAIAKRRIRSFQIAVKQALELWLAQDAGAAPAGAVAPPAGGPETEWHRKLSEILASGDEAAIEAVKAQLTLIHTRLRPPGRKRKAV
jgi:hypothetical protein